MREIRNETTKDILYSMFIAAVGLILFGVGVYLTIQANIGANPWDVFELGLSHQLGILYGDASVGVSLVLVVIDVLTGECIGLGMFLDAFLVGKTVDLLNWIGLVPQQQNFWFGLVMLLVGIFIEGYSQYFYMRAALGCGPRDTFLVMASKKLPKIPIGVISIGILSIVTLAGWLLGGPVGIGTLICAFATGPAMEFAFRLKHFEATKVHHQDIITSFKIFFKNVKQKTE